MITKIMKILYYEYLELYGNSNVFNFLMNFWEL